MKGKTRGSSPLGWSEAVHIPKHRPPILASEPVEASRALGRPLQEWEMFLVVEARLQERARELVLFRGLP